METISALPLLFRTEFSRITAVLCHRFGFRHVEAAEDIAGDTFLQALETWPYRGIPENPKAWLYTVAGNKAKNLLRRNQKFSSDITPGITRSSPSFEDNGFDWEEAQISDSQLQMLFAVCDPSLPSKAQVCLALRILCGFGIDQIATALLLSPEAVSKQLTRGKEKLRGQDGSASLSKEIDPGRLEHVLMVIYLLFNEGYYSESDDAVINQDFCLEAMRLTQLLLDYQPTDTGQVNALMSLMCFHVSRFAARKKETGEPVLYLEQEESLWNRELIARGATYLRQASQGNALSRYHLEAGIAYWQTVKQDSTEKWEAVLFLYNHLLLMEYSPLAALNRTFALSKVDGPAAAIREAEKLKLPGNPYYFALLGTLYETFDPAKARSAFDTALSFAKTSWDKQVMKAARDRLQGS